MKIKEHDTQLSYDINSYNIKLNNEKNTNLLKSYGLYSLTRLLKSPLKVHLNFKSNKKESNSYHAIIDSTGIKKLESLLSSSEYCAIDTEADDKDPHHATLFGVSFSVKKGEAYFVPLLENDLKDINQEDVVSFLKRVVKMQIKFIGHNIKYDYLLLRRNGINIQNVYFDTMLAAYECYGDWIFFNLKYLSHKLLGKDIKSYKEIVDREETFLELPFKKIVQHACEDADMTFRLYHVLRGELERKGLTSQYFEDTIPLLIKLGGFEFNGIPCNLKKLEKMRRSMLTQLLNLKQNIFDNVGKTFDIDSSKELAVIINDTLKLQEFVRNKKITLSILEQLSINRHVPRLLVRYKRLQRQIKTIDSIAKNIKNKKIHPIFNQIKPPHGQFSSSKPNIFNKDVISNIEICFGKEVKAFFKDHKKSLNILEDLTEDSTLRKDRANKNKRNQFMANHPLMKELDYDELLLKIIIGTHDSFLSKRFMVDKTTISTIIYDLKIRYSSLFQWIEKFQKETSIRGFASFNSKRKYLDGLKSSNIAKRKKALNDVVRWLVQY